MRENKYRKRQVVCAEGEPGDCLYYVRWGSVGVYAAWGTDDQRKLAELHAGDCFGEMSVIDHAPRSATVVVLESGTILDRVAEDDFEEFIARQPNEAYRILEGLCHKLRKVTRRYVEAAHAAGDAVDQKAEIAAEGRAEGLAEGAALGEAADVEAAVAQGTAVQDGAQEASADAVTKRLAYRSGEVIFAEGTYATTMYEVASGQVGIYASHGTADERQLATLGVGQTFGEMGLVECYPRSATAVALDDDVVLLEVSFDEFRTYMAEQPQKVLSIMRQISARMRETNQRYEQAAAAARRGTGSGASDGSGGLRDRLWARLRRGRR